jgi:hypothetical protein
MAQLQRLSVADRLGQRAAHWPFGMSHTHLPATTQQDATPQANIPALAHASQTDLDSLRQPT